ncbi:ParB family chromosome partitioning protein [Lachnospiraceae bacterium PM6-15]|uniref:ParB/RepB/Spo0J family partition protein n=1 Tax=Ohessyouella blattaphilus TaxID=2949333 RepID=UPI003E2D541A
MNEKKRDLGLTALDELFADEKTLKEAELPKIYEISLDQIDDLPGHPFQVRMDEDMDELVGSIKTRGVITPIIIRPKEEGRYEIVSGHRRRKASEIAGYKTIRAEIKEMTRDESIILMVDSNLQRTTILPSEKAFSYKMRLEAMKRQAGRPSQDNSAPMEPNLKGVRSNEQLAEQVGESTAQIKRYICLTELIPPILQMVDERQIAFRPAVELSYLTEKEQQSLYDTMLSEDCTPSLAQAIKIKQFSQSQKLSEDVIFSILSEEKPNQKEKISFKVERLRKYIPQSIPINKAEDYVLKALDHYNRYRERQKDKER